jgi:parvulin-like peptidyl-prolyl isomerase
MSSNPPSTPRRVRSLHESKSATVRAAAAAPSRRQLSRWQRDQQQQRMLYAAIGALVLVIAGIFAAGLVYDNVVRASQVVAQVGPESITAGQLLAEVQPQARALDAQAKQFGGGANSQQIADYVSNQKRSLPDQVLNDAIDARIIQQEAARRGISVTPAEVDDKERQTVAQFQAANNPSPTVEPTATTEASPTAAAALTSATPSAIPTATVLTTPTAVPTLEGDAYASALQQFLDKNGLTEADLRTQLERGLLQDKLQAAMGQEQVPDSQPQVHARQIVVPAQDQANDLLGQLQNGADFATLAQQNSTDVATKANGGDMGWFGRGVQTKQLEDAVFALQPGQLSGVIQDSAGYHIVQAIETDPSRAVPPDQLTSQRQKAFNDWLTAQRSGPDVKLSLDQGQKDWILTRLGIRP